VERLQPVERVADQEVADLVAAEVEDERAPVLVLALPRVLVLVERRAVEPRQRVCVLREVPGHPVEQDADALLMARVDEEAEVVRRSEAARRGEVPRDLVAPRSLEGVLHYGQQLDVREAQRLDVGHQLGGQFAPAERSVALIGVAAPRSRVHLVDRERRVEHRPAPTARRHPHRVTPRMSSEMVGDGGGAGRTLVGQREWIDLLEHLAVAGLERELVEDAVAEARDERLPQPAGAEAAQRMRARVPSVEVADHRRLPRVRRPDDERVSRLAGDGRRASAHLLPRAQPGALAEEIGLVVGNHPLRFRGVLGAHGGNVSGEGRGA
jgi:hypothetical protein